ncbi:MAG: hypothetical protein AVDCRST_MAG35-193, partial [uncultured Quadrisphaera sp.]
MRGPGTRRPGGSPSRRLLALPAARWLVPACAVLGAGVWALLVVQWALVAAFVVTVVDGGAT